MSVSASSGRSGGDCTAGEHYSCCRRWQDPEADFEDVVVRGRRGPYVSVEVLSGPEAGQTVNVLGSTLWSADQMDHARERRQRDLRIAELDREHPADGVSDLAIEILGALATEDTDVESRATVETVLAQLGRSTDLSELHELAYAGAAPYSPVAAPAEAWRRLFEEFARAMPGLIEERGAETANRWSWISPADRSAALARVRIWAGLPPIAQPMKVDLAPKERNEGRRLEQTRADAAAELLASVESVASSDSLSEAFSAYQIAREQLDDDESSLTKTIDARVRIREFGDQLCDRSARSAQPLMSWLLRECGLRGRWCDNIVWSDYSAQHPRTLHLFPDGHLFPEEEGVSRRISGTLTACGEQILLRWSANRSWERAAPGEWLEHYEAMIGYQEKVEAHEAAGEELPYRYFDPEYQMARRICPKCATFHGMFMECVESSEASRRWSPWRFAEIKENALELLSEQLGSDQPIGTLEKAEHIAMEAWIEAEISTTARELKLRGPGTLRRLFWEREGRGPSLYLQWSEACEPAGLEPHELMSQELWQRVLTDSIEFFRQQDVPIEDRRSYRDEVRKVTEARIAGLS